MNLKRRELAATLLILAGCSSRPEPAPLPGLSKGPYSVTTDGGPIELTRDGGVLLTLPSDAFQLGTVRELEDSKSYDPYWLVHDDAFFDPVIPQGLRWRKVVASSVTRTESSLELALTFEGELKASVTITADAEGRFKARWVPAATSTPIAFMKLRLRTDATEGFYGLGEVFDDVNHRGKLRPMQIEPDLEIESANTETHVPVPLLIGTRGWGVFVASKRYGIFDVARAEPDLVEITYGTAEQSDAGLEFHLFAAQHPLDITKKYYEVTGNPLVPAPTWLGPLLWRDENRDQAQVLDDVQQIRARDLAVTGMWIDRPYATSVNSFDFNPAQFPDAGAMIQAIHNAGLRLALWHTPYLEPGTEPLLSQALDGGFFPPKIGGGPSSPWGPPIDFTNPRAMAFWQTNLQQYVDLGVEGYKLDYGEEVAGGVSGGRTRWGFSDGTTERTMQHDFTLLYHRAYAQKQPGFLLCRAGKWGDQTQVSVIWPGDIDATMTKWKEPVQDGNKTVAGTGGLPAAIIAGMSLGPSGFPFFGADTGGYRHSPPNRETWIRWVEQSALSTVMQVGDSSSQMPWEYTPENGRDDAALDIFRTYARLHLRLAPYEWHYAERLAIDGRAIQRPLGLAYPELGKHPNDEYLFGDDLLVAPVITPGATSRTVLFPPGEWIDWWDGSVHQAGEETVAAPIEKLPLYIRRGGIVPMLRPTIDTLSFTLDSDVDSYLRQQGPLWVRAVPTGKIKLRFQDVIEVSPTEVKFESTEYREGIIEILDVPRPSLVTQTAPSTGAVTARTSRADVEANLGWFHEGRTLWLHVGSSATITIAP